MIDWNMAVTAFSFGIGLLLGYIIGYAKGILKQGETQNEE